MSSQFGRFPEDQVKRGRPGKSRGGKYVVYGWTVPWGENPNPPHWKRVRAFNTEQKANDAVRQWTAARRNPYAHHEYQMYRMEIEE